MTNNIPKLTQLYNDELPKIGDRVWTMERVKEMDELTKKIMDFNHGLHGIYSTAFTDMNEKTTLKPGAEYPTMNMLGNHFELATPDVPEGKKLEVHATPYHVLAEALNAENASLADGALWKIRSVPIGHNLTEGCQKSNTGRSSDYSSYDFWKARWEGTATDIDGKIWHKREKHVGGAGSHPSEFMNRSELTNEQRNEDDLLLQQWTRKRAMLQKYIKEFGKQLVNVDKILCCGLGSLNGTKPKTFVQHLAAVTVRDEIHKLRGGKGVKIEIIAQDPAYCTNCTQVLKGVLDITAVTGFEGHLSLTRNTFVISVFPGGPVCQMVADLALDFGGPAAMLCDAFDDDHMAPEHNPEGRYHSNEPTKNMVAYKTRCEVRDFADAINVLGMTHDAFSQKYPTVGGMLLAEWVRDKKDIRDLYPLYDKALLANRVDRATKGDQVWIKGLKRLTDADKEYFAKCLQLHRLDMNVYFPTSMLYVRKD